MGWQDAPVVPRTIEIVGSSKDFEKESWRNAPIVKADAEKPMDPTGSFGENLLAGAGKAMTDAARGLEQVFPFRDRTANQRAIEESRKLDAPLMKTGGGITGNIAGTLALAAPTAMMPGAGTTTAAGMIGGALGALQPTVEGESRLANTAIGGAAGTAGKVGMDKIGQALSAKLGQKTAQLATEKAGDQVKQATLAASRVEGYVVPPTQANARSAWNQILESFSGKIKTGQLASVKNQEVTNKLARQALGLPKDAPITPQALDAVRTQAGQVYKAVEGLSAIKPDAKFDMALQSLARNRSGGATTNPADEAIDSLIKELRGFNWDGKALIGDIKNLREMAKANFGAADRAGGDVSKSAMARAQSKAAEILEELAERNLSANKAPATLISDFRNARQLIAKTYTVENALNEATGNVVGVKLATQLARGKPLSGELEKVARFAQAFPDSARDLSARGSSSLMGSPLDWAASGGLAAASGNPAMLAGVMARPAARGAILSKPYQSMMTRPNYTPNALLRGSSGVANNALVNRLASPLAAEGAFLYPE